MKAIILAAGNGIRMRPLTKSCPKPMLKVCGEPLLAHIVGAFPDEVDELVIVTGHLGEQIRSFFGSTFGGRRIGYAFQKKRLGNYQALTEARRFIKEGERFFVLFADDLHGRKGFIECLKHPRAIVAHTIDRPERFGVVVMDAKGCLEKITEKPEHPESNLVTPGVYLLDQHIFFYRPAQEKNGEYYLTTAVQDMLSDYPVRVVETDFWLPVSHPEDLQKAEQFLQQNNK